MFTIYLFFSLLPEEEKYSWQKVTIQLLEIISKRIIYRNLYIAQTLLSYFFERIPLTFFVRVFKRTSYLISTIKPDDKKIKIKPDTISCSYSHLIQKLWWNNCSWPVWVIPQCPDVAGIHKKCSIQKQQYFKSVFRIQLKFDIALIYKYDRRFFQFCQRIPISSWTRLFDIPRSETIGSTYAKLSDEWSRWIIAKRNDNAKI